MDCYLIEQIFEYLHGDYLMKALSTSKKYREIFYDKFWIIIPNKTIFVSDHIKAIKTSKNFSSSLPILPEKLEYLSIGNKYYKEIKNLHLIAPNLKYLKLGNSYRHFIHEYPQNLEYLEFGQHFNSPVGNLPPNLKYLIFGRDFNWNVDYLPASVQHIKFGSAFNNNIDNLPASIKYIKLGCWFGKKINKLPKNLETIIVYPYYEYWGELKILAEKQGIKIE